MLTKTDKKILRFIEEYNSITIYQCYRIFFKDMKYGHDYARKRLKILSQMGLLKRGKNQVTNEMVYFDEKMISAHDLFLLDFYSLLVYNGAEIIEFKKEPVFVNIRPDGFFKYKFNDIVIGVCVEVDFTHATVLTKYELLMQGYFKANLGGNPYVCVISENFKKVKVDFDVVYLDFKLNSFVSKILS